MKKPIKKLEKDMISLMKGEKPELIEIGAQICMENPEKSHLENVVEGGFGRVARIERPCLKGENVGYFHTHGISKNLSFSNEDIISSAVWHDKVACLGGIKHFGGDRVLGCILFDDVDDDTKNKLKEIGKLDAKIISEQIKKSFRKPYEDTKPEEIKVNRLLDEVNPIINKKLRGWDDHTHDEI